MSSESILEMVKVIGIDPGSLRTGFAVIDSSERNPKYITSGTIVLSDKEPLAERLLSLAKDFDAIVKKYRPQQLAIESLFFAKNAQSALKLGHARGVLLMKAAEHKLEIFEYAPTEVKASIIGSGRAQKDQVAQMIKILLKLPKNFNFSSNDQSDALAICLTHVQSNSIKGLKKNDRSAYWENSV